MPYDRSVVFIRIAAVVAISLAVTGCKTEQKVAAKDVITVRAWTVRPTATEGQLRYAGSVEAMAQVTLAFRSSGFVQSVRMVRGVDGRTRPLETGDFVEAGSVLATVRNTEYRARTDAAGAQVSDVVAARGSAMAQVAEAKAATDQAELDWTRAQTLFAARAMTKADFDAAKARVDAARARLEGAQAQVTSLEARIENARAAERETRVALGDTSLTAPFSGFVVSRRVERGAFAEPGAPAFTLADLSRAKVVFFVPDALLSQLRPGTKVGASIEAIGSEDVPCTVESISPSADPATRTFRVEAVTPNGGKKLRAGMVASVAVGQPAASKSLVVPLSALVRGESNRGDDLAVFALDGSVVRRRNVRIGEAQGNLVAVLNGLSEGQRIVQDGVARLKDGEMVQVLQ